MKALSSHSLIQQSLRPSTNVFIEYVSGGAKEGEKQMKKQMRQAHQNLRRDQADQASKMEEVWSKIQHLHYHRSAD